MHGEVSGFGDEWGKEDGEDGAECATACFWDEWSEIRGLWRMRMRNVC